jgi:hypothetical protein
MALPTSTSEGLLSIELSKLSWRDTRSINKPASKDLLSA